MRRLRKMRKFQYLFIGIYFVLLLASLLFFFLRITQIIFALLLVAFPVALVVAVYGSLAIREEEEETS